MKQQVMYKYSKMELEQFAMFEENCHPGTTEVQFQTEAQFSFDKEHSVLSSTIVVSMYNQEKPLVKSELKSFFELLPESMNSLRKDNSLHFPPTLLVQFASLCYGSIRGVLYTKTMNTSLNNIVLPPLYFNTLIDKEFVVEE